MRVKSFTMMLLFCVRMLHANFFSLQRAARSRSRSMLGLTVSPTPLFPPAPITKHEIYGQDVYVFRDDLINVHGLSGNKARKVQSATL